MCGRAMDAPWAARYGSWRQSGVTGWALRGDEFDRPYRGVLRPAGISVDSDVRISDAVALAGPRDVITGWAAARMHGAAYVDGLSPSLEPIPVTVLSRHGAQHRPRGDLHPTRRSLHDHEITDVDGISVTTLARATYDMCLDARSDVEALIAVDMCTSRVAGGARTTLDNVAAVVRSHVKTRGIARARRAVGLGSDRSGSPWETRTRWAARRAGLKGLLVNEPVFDLTGRFLAVVDLIDPQVGLVVESDGSGHRLEDVHADDNVREEILEHVGLVVARVTARDHRDPTALGRRLVSAHAMARSSPRPQAWTVEPPHWWAGSTSGRRWA